MSTTTAVKMISERQSAYILRLAEERDTAQHPILGAEGAKPVTAETITELTQSGASVMIDWLQECPRKPLVHEDGTVVGEGYYLLLDVVYRVVPAKHSGNVYAKALVVDPDGRLTWEYAPGVMKSLTSANRLTIEQAAETGRLLGRCIVCGAELTTVESVTAGIGPVCRTRL